MVFTEPPAMFSSAPTHRPPVMAAQQHSHPSYFGYYPQQAPTQYAPPDFNCNLQHFMTPPQFGEGAWSSHPMYMGPPCQQRSPAAYDDWSAHHTGHHGAVSPLSASGGSQVPLGLPHQPPHTPSPCAHIGPPASPAYGQPYYKRHAGVGLEADAHESFGPLSGDGATPAVETSPETTTTTTTTAGSVLHRPRSPFEWMKKTSSYQAATNAADTAFVEIGSAPLKEGKTRTKDKYRVVYSDHQRLELEKEFHYSRYITIKRKAELAVMLGLSERQVKIWFQNRRAKERKQMKKRDEMMQKEKLENMHVPHATPMAMHGGHPHQHLSPSKVPQLMMEMVDIKPPPPPLPLLD